MSIYDILASKPHNQHYLNRYINFVVSCQQKNVDYCGPVENHHICPKADDMFPEYIDFSSHPWNKASLTPRQHLIAHQILSKAFPDIYSIVYSYWAMSHMKGERINSRLYESVRKTVLKKNGENIRKRIEAGNHHWYDEFGNNISNKKRLESGTHNFLGPESNRKRIEDGTHNFLSNDHRLTTKERQLKRVKEGTHHFQSQEYKYFISMKTKERNDRLVQDGNHHFLGKKTCVDIDGNIITISVEDYIENDSLVPVSSIEGRKRLGRERVKLKPRTDEHKYRLSQSLKKRLSIDPAKHPNFGKKRRLMSRGTETRFIETHLIDAFISDDWIIGYNQNTKKVIDQTYKNKPIIFDGVKYNSIKECISITGLSRREILKTAIKV